MESDDSFFYDFWLFVLLSTAYFVYFFAQCSFLTYYPVVGDDLYHLFPLLVVGGDGWFWLVMGSVLMIAIRVPVCFPGPVEYGITYLFPLMVVFYYPQRSKLPVPWPVSWVIHAQGLMTVLVGVLLRYPIYGRAVPSPYYPLLMSQILYWLPGESQHSHIVRGFLMILILAISIYFYVKVGEQEMCGEWIEKIGWIESFAYGLDTVTIGLGIATVLNELLRYLL